MEHLYAGNQISCRSDRLLRWKAGPIGLGTSAHSSFMKRTNSGTSTTRVLTNGSATISTAGHPWLREPASVYRPDGGLWLKSAYFTSEGKHADDCRPAPEPHEQSLPNSTSGAPVSFPSEIYLFTDLSKPGAAALLSERRAGHDWSDSFHDSRERSIRRACMFYAEDAANHSRRLWVQRCAGNSYAECFVLLVPDSRRSSDRCASSMVRSTSDRPSGMTRSRWSYR